MTVAYNSFTLRDVKQRFGLATVEDRDLFADAAEVPPGERLAGVLRDYLPLATAVNTEKARSELLIAPTLLELRARADRPVSWFSGVEFAVDPAAGLTGYCDYILCRSAEQLFVSAPVMLVAEAKADAPKNGFGQCAAGMVAARLFNERDGRPTPVVYGAATTGLLWRFLTLSGGDLFIDRTEYHISQVGKILGILLRIVTAVPE
jgi:hypothetical protein